MSDVTNVSILEEYLITRSNIRKYFKLEDLIELFPNDVSMNLITQIYQNICAQQEAKNQRISQNINHDFDFPIEDIISELNEKSTIGKTKLVKLIAELESLQMNLNNELRNLDEDILEKLTELNNSIGKLDELKVESDQYYNDVINDSIEKCNQLSALLDIM